MPFSSSPPSMASSSATPSSNMRENSRCAKSHIIISARINHHMAPLLQKMLPAVTIPSGHHETYNTVMLYIIVCKSWYLDLLVFIFVPFHCCSMSLRHCKPFLETVSCLECFGRKIVQYINVVNESISLEILSIQRIKNYH